MAENNLDKDLIVKSSTDNLNLIRDFIRTSAREVGFNEDTIGKVILAVDEACTNVIKHAYKYSPEGEININLKFNDPEFIISITDDGSKFNPDIVPEPDIKEYHKQKRIGGLGMFLMKKLMDKVEYKHADDRNQVVLVKLLS